MLELIVFDCDGVMFDSKPANIAYYNAMLHHFNLPSMDDAEVEYVHMGSVLDSIEHIFRKHSHINMEDVLHFRSQLSYKPFLSFMTMEPDLRQFLEYAQGKFNLAISTNRTDTMVPLLKEYDLDHFFSKVMTANLVENPKPAPDAMLEILNHFKLRPEQAIFIGDSTFDELHAQSSGVPFIAFKNQNLNADYYVNSFMEILTLPPLRQALP